MAHNTIGRDFDIKYFTGDNIEDEFLCSICNNVLQNPVNTPCDHLFCSGCIRKWLKQPDKESTCPICRKHITLNKVSAAPRIIQRLLEKLFITCKYHDRGCTFKIRLDSVDSMKNHVFNQCEFDPELALECTVDNPCKICELERKKHFHS